jgi:hypothetical protein
VQTTVQRGQQVAGDVVDVVDGLAVPYWLIETSVFRVRRPLRFSVVSPQDEGDNTPFYLQGPGQATIFPQGPVAKARLTDPDALVATIGVWRLVRIQAQLLEIKQAEHFADDEA